MRHPAPHRMDANDLKTLIETYPLAMPGMYAGIGAVVGAATRLFQNHRSREKCASVPWLPGGSFGSTVSSTYLLHGGPLDYVENIACALVGDYLGTKIIDAFYPPYPTHLDRSSDPPPSQRYG
jgi:hypothetical protein